MNETNHAEIIIDDQSYTIDTASQNENDCMYNVVLVAKELSKGKTLSEAIKILGDNEAVKCLRNDVSLALKNDKSLLNQLRWTNRTDSNSHFDSLTGLSLEGKDLIVSEADVKDLRGNEKIIFKF